MFAGGGTYEAIEEVSSADPDTLQSLLDKSLLRRRDTDFGPRYWMLETIREYAAERLEQAGEAGELRAKQSRFFLEFAEAGDRAMLGAEQAARLARFDEEHDNLRVALATLHELGARRDEGRLAAALSNFWFSHGHIREAREILGRMIALRDEMPAPERILLMRSYVWALHWHGEWRTALTIAEEALTTCQELDDSVLTAKCQNTLGVIATELDDGERARALFEQSLAVLRVSEESQLQVAPLLNLGGLAWQLGEYVEAKRLLNEGRAIAAELGPEYLGNYLANLGITHALDGDPDAALELLREALLLYRAAGHMEVPYALEGMAGAYAALGETSRATELVAAAAALRERFGTVSDSWERRVHEFAFAAGSGLDKLAVAEAGAKWRSRTLEDAVDYALIDMA